MQEKIKSFLESKSKVKIFVVLVLIGIILVLFSSTFSNSDKKDVKKDADITYEQYTNDLEKRLCNTISSIDGVGQCNVMITLKSGNESVYAKNTESKTDEESYDESKDYVIVDNGNSEEPVLLNEYFADIQGVAIVCSGGDNPAVREEIIQTVSALFNISSNRISVSKINN